MTYIRKTILFFLFITFIFLSTSNVAANNSDINIIIDNKEVITDSSPIISSGRVLVPVRVISEELGYQVYWDSNAEEVYIYNNYSNIKLKIGQDLIWNNGNEVEIDVVPQIINGRTLIPIRAVSENLDALISWDSNTKSVIIKTKEIKYSNSTNSELDSIISKNESGVNLVVIDPGHGGKDPGAISINGRKEKDFNLAVAKKVNEILMQDSSIEVVLTRYIDEYISLDDRVDFANNLDADLYVSIHGNAHPYRPDIHGIETYYISGQGYVFAEILHDSLLDTVGFYDRGIRYSEFRVIKNTTMPAVLTEIGYLTNKYNEPLMYQADYQQKAAEGIANAIREYFD